MSDLYNDIQAIKQKSDVVKDQKVARFSYTNTAYQNDIAAGVENYDAPSDQNVPLSTKTDLNDTVIDKGVRGQAASLPRNALNHFFGRMSYNLNKMHDWFNTVIDKLLRSMAMNGSRYTATTKYRQYDVVTFVDTAVTPPQVRYFFRHSTDPAELVGSAPMIAGVVQTAQWAEYSDVAARAHSYIRRDANGRAKVAVPVDADDIARKDNVDVVQASLTSHTDSTNPHSATSAATSSRLVLRDAAGRAAFVSPSAAGDAATKGYVDTLVGGVTDFKLTNHGTSVGASVALPALTIGAVSLCYGYGRKNTTSEAVLYNLPSGGTYRVYAGGGAIGETSGAIMQSTDSSYRSRIKLNAATSAGGEAAGGSGGSVGVSWYFVYAIIIQRVS